MTAYTNDIYGMLLQIADLSGAPDTYSHDRYGQILRLADKVGAAAGPSYSGDMIGQLKRVNDGLGIAAGSYSGDIYGQVSRLADGLYGVGGGGYGGDTYNQLRRIAVLGGVGAGNSYIGPGDLKPGAFAWWGLRAYTAASIGSNCVDIIRASDGITKAFKTVAGGGIDTAGIATFLLGTTGKVSTLYDQTGNGWHLTQATGTKQPDWVAAERSFANNYPTMKFTAGNVQQLVSAATGLSTSTCTISAVAMRSGNFTNYNGILEAATVGMSFDTSPDALLIFQGTVQPANKAADYSQHTIQQVYNSTSTISCVDGNLITSGFNPGSTTFGSPFTMGSIGGAANVLTGTINEAGFWNSIWSAADCSAVHANQANYYFKANSAYEGLVAQRCRFIQGALDTSNKYLNSRSAHIATDDISSLRCALASSTSGSSTTLTASIEYPANTFTQLLFGGSSTATVAAGQSIFSDAVNVTVPNGATFWVRTFLNNAGGIIYNSWQNTFLGEAAQLSVSSISDLTMGGTITNSGAISFPPMAVLAVTSRPSVLALGDSICAGFHDTEDTSSSITGYNGKVGVIARSLGTATFANFGQSGVAAPEVTARRIIPKVSHLICNYGANNFFMGQSSATLIANLVTTFAYARPFQKLYQTTITPKAASSDGWATLGNQTTDATVNPPRVTFNTALRAGSTGLPLTGYFDVASVVESSLNSGKWAVTGVANAYTSDGLHPVTASYVVVQTANLIPIPVWP